LADISFTVPRDSLSQSLEVARTVGGELGASEVTSDSEVARVSVIGAGMKSQPGVTATMFETLAKEAINIEMISTSAIRISCMVREALVEQAVQSLHEAFGLGATTS
jgi:aspartate kinase